MADATPAETPAPSAPPAEAVALGAVAAAGAGALEPEEAFEVLDPDVEAARWGFDAELTTALKTLQENTKDVQAVRVVRRDSCRAAAVAEQTAAVV